MLLCGGWLILAAAHGHAQEPHPPADAMAPSHADAMHGAGHGTGHGAGKHEITAEDVPDHEPELVTRWRVRAEYVLWLVKNGQTPPLLSTGLNTSPTPGVLGSGGRSIYGGDIDLHERHGGLFTIGYGFDDVGCAALELIYGFSGPQKVGFTTTSLGSTAAFPVLARPFFDVVNNKEDASLVAFPGLVAGTVDIKYGTYFDTGEVNFSRQLLGEQENRLDVLGGFRIFRLNESLNITESSTVDPNTMDPNAMRFAGRTINVNDVFETQNTFYGGQLGMRGFLRRKRWELEIGAKVALGLIDRESRVSGATVINTNPLTYVPAGLLALSSNSGVFGSTAFSVLPEANVRLGYRVTEHFQAFFGYSFLYVSQVLRPGDQVDRNINPNLVPTSATFGAGGPAQPAPLERSSDFWVHGLRFGIEVKF